MSDSCREQVVAKAQDVLKTITGLTTSRNRRIPLEVADLPCAILFEGDEVQNDTFAGEDGFDLPLLIQVAVAETGAAAASLCNNWRAKLQQALLADRTLGGKARNLEIVDPGQWIGVESNVEDAEGFMLGLSVRYATVEGDPFTFFN